MNTLHSLFDLKMKKPLHKHPLLQAVFFSIGMMCTLSLHATHIIGTELRYECLGGNNYRIILDVYRIAVICRTSLLTRQPTCLFLMTISTI